MTSNDNNLEYAVSQAVDGVLADADRRRLGDALHSADAQTFAAEHGEIKALLRTYADVPEIDFDAFANTFSQTLAGEEAYAPAPLSIAPASVWPAWRRRLAVAAAIALTGAASWPFLPHAQQSSPNNAGGQILVQVSNATPVDHTPPTEIAVGPSKAMIDKGFTVGLAPENAAMLKPKVIISSVEMPGDVRPY